MLEQIRLGVKANVPLGSSLAAAAEDFLYLERGWTPQRVARLSKVAGISLLLLLSLLGALGALATVGPEAIRGLIRPIVIAFWLYFAAVKRHYKPMGVLVSLQRSINQGCSLSEAMGKLPRFFPAELVSQVAMAERTGNLEVILDNFSTETVKKWTAQRDFSRVLNYVWIGLSIQAGVIAFLAVKVFSVFEEILMELHVPLGSAHTVPGLPVPLPSIEDIFAIANFFSVHRYHVAMICWLAGLWLVLRPWRRRRVWSSRVESTFLLSIPGLRGMVARQNLASIAFQLNQYLLAGVPLEHALDVVSRGGLHPLYARWVAQVRKRILNGSTLREACSHDARAVPVPGSFIAMVAMGETHGRLEETLAYLAEQYQAGVERRKKFLRSCVLPMGVFLMGYIVLGLETALFQAMVDMADAIMP
ncbi:MAG: type II secretion system F family protein [Candidatus Hydrogenedentes bacterium]|nr:type II secretion system F family protein [Candidatus Hydrogenedentota bacterium]